MWTAECFIDCFWLRYLLYTISIVLNQCWCVSTFSSGCVSRFRISIVFWTLNYLLWSSNSRWLFWLTFIFRCLVFTVIQQFRWDWHTFLVCSLKKSKISFIKGVLKRKSNCPATFWNSWPGFQAQTWLVNPTSSRDQAIHYYSDAIVCYTWYSKLVFNPFWCEICLKVLGHILTPSVCSQFRYRLTALLCDHRLQLTLMST